MTARIIPCFVCRATMPSPFANEGSRSAPKRGPMAGRSMDRRMGAWSIPKRQWDLTAGVANFPHPQNSMADLVTGRGKVNPYSHGEARPAGDLGINQNKDARSC